ncbi:hypothetical protein CQW23_10701 [Capsicum baccatum]|uniref:Uncharacterized protein n=1 Tax=Capsicum baccatum TaxID=33114 RepID=A0A2G2X0D1_CAPBA|nr:hypothetical protein CQW23_10701 [Capsicum baccatum]
MDLQFCRSKSYLLSRRAKRIAVDGRDCVDFSYPASPVGIEVIPNKDDEEFELRKSTEKEVMVALTNEIVTIIGICGMVGVGKIMLHDLMMMVDVRMCWWLSDSTVMAVAR